jgi:hypothetical protein
MTRINVLFLLVALGMIALAWQVESDALERKRQPLQCPAGVTAPADCTTTEGERP